MGKHASCLPAIALLALVGCASKPVALVQPSKPPPFAPATTSADPAFEVGKPLPCQAKWVFQQAQANLPHPVAVFDFSSRGDDVDGKFAQDIASGGMPALISTIAFSMKRGATEPSNVTLAGPQIVLDPILLRVENELEGKQLPHLTFLLVGPTELEATTRRIIEDRKGAFRFVPYATQNCAQARQ